MKTASKRILLAGLLATVAAAAMAQAPATPPADGKPMMRMGHGDPAKMKEYIAKRQAELKAKLAITPAQEGAWTAWTATMQPPATRPAHPSREEIAKLSTPERIDKMKAMHNERYAAMEKRGEATKTFYAALTPDQKKVFDAETLRMGGRHRGGPGGHGMMHKG